MVHSGQRNTAVEKMERLTSYLLIENGECALSILVCQMRIIYLVFMVWLSSGPHLQPKHGVYGKKQYPNGGGGSSMCIPELTCFSIQNCFYFKGSWGMLENLRQTQTRFGRYVWILCIFVSQGLGSSEISV